METQEVAVNGYRPFGPGSEGEFEVYLKVYGTPEIKTVTVEFIEGQVSLPQAKVR